VFVRPDAQAEVIESNLLSPHHPQVSELKQR
jgi:hypothetical protein